MRRALWVPVVIVLFIWTLTTHGKFSNSGDEPHYLEIAESLLNDRDLDLENNYQSNSGFDPGPHVRRNRHGALWSVHDIGVAVVLLPVYAVATAIASRAPEDVLVNFRQTRDLFRYSLISMSLVVATAWAVWLLISGITRGAPRYAAAAGLVFALAPPVMTHAFLVFPETLALIVTCVVVWLTCLRTDERGRGGPRPYIVALIVAAIGCLPWLHRKYSFFVFGLGFLVAAQHWKWLRQQPRLFSGALAALLIVPQLALHVWTIWAWGTIGGPQMLDGLPFSIAGLQTGSLGLILDRERGLLGYAPIYLIAPACIALSWRNSRTLLVPVLLLFVPMAAFVTWDAGFSPAARFLVPLTPLVLLAAARVLEHAAVRWTALLLGTFQLAISLYAWQYPRTIWPKGLGTNQILERIPLLGPVYERWLPSIMTGETVWSAWICIADISIVTVALVQIARRQEQPE